MLRHRSLELKVLLAALQRALAAHGVHRAGTDVVLVACSGGRDSVALAHAAVTTLGARRVVLGHVDHGVRPESALDAVAVRSWAGRLGVEAVVDRLPPGPADEARLRAGRYRALERQRRTVDARVILTAHTRDDQAETVLMGLLRSARPAALAGIPTARGAVLRPWLTVPRAAVDAYVARHALTVVEDPTNREPRYLRNRIRKELLPLLERRCRPRLSRRLAGLAARIRAAGLANLEPAPEPGPLEAAAEPDGAARGADSAGPGPPEARRAPNAGDSRGSGRPGAGDEGQDRAPGHPLTAWLRGRACLKMERRPWLRGAVPDGTVSAAFDADAVGALRVRRLRDGDRMRPFGMQGHRKLRDLLRERGVPASDRPGALVVVDEADRVLWLPGVARSALAPIVGTTREVWWLSIGQDHELQARESRATLDSAVGGTTVD